MGRDDEETGPPPQNRKHTGATDRSGKLSQVSKNTQRKLMELLGDAYRELNQSTADLSGMIGSDESRREARGNRKRKPVVSKERMDRFKEERLKDSEFFKEALIVLRKQLKESKTARGDGEGDAYEEIEEDAEAQQLRGQIEARVKDISVLQEKLLKLTKSVDDESFLYDPKEQDSGEESDEYRRAKVEERMQKFEERLTKLKAHLIELQGKLKKVVEEKDDEEVGGFPVV